MFAVREIGIATSVISPPSILVLERSSSFFGRLSSTIASKVGMKPIAVDSATEAAVLIEQHPGSFFAGVVCLKCPGANALVEMLTQNGIPVVVYGNDFDDESRKGLATLGIAELVVDKSEVLPDRVGNALAQLAANKDITILVADDSRSMRAALVRFLSTQCYTIKEASDGEEALDILAGDPSIQLIITDNEMPKMDGFSLVTEIRKQYSKDDLAVIGISAKSNSALSVQFITNGANDFLQKPFVKEELYCRVSHNLEMLRRIRLIRDLSYKDPLTKLYNRRYFFENSQDFVDTAREQGVSVSVAMVDIDFFKAVNDTYGHDGGDRALQSVAVILEQIIETGAIVSRFGGEEFCLIVAHPAGDDVFGRYDKLRRTIENTVIDYGDEKGKLTVSIGVCTKDVSVEEMIMIADGRLYAAKDSGRNKVILA